MVQKIKILIACIAVLGFISNSVIAYDSSLDRECLVIYPEKYYRAARALEQYHEGDSGSLNGPKIGTTLVSVETINQIVGDNLDDYCILWAGPPDSLTSGGGYSNSSL